MHQDPQIARAQAEMNRFVSELSALQVKWWRPFRLFKTIEKLRKTSISLVNLCGDAMVTQHEVVDAVDQAVSVDVELEQKINTMWAEVYENEENRRTLQQRVEALERNAGLSE